MDVERAPCGQCPPPSTACTGPSCLIPEFTAECTDDCLVVACDDPDHDSQTCLVTDGEIPCDGTCIAAAACSDCPGLDEICCTDYYLADPKPYGAPSILRWETHFSDLPCDCTHDLQSIAPQSSLPHSVQSLISDASVSSSASSSPSLRPFSPSTQPFTCMWASCGSVFSSLSDLVGHVNLHHLCSMGTQNHPALPVQSHDNPHIFSQSLLSCHWGDCARFPSPSSIPGSSSASSDDDALNILATHLMQDHLGVNSPFALLNTPLSPVAGPHGAGDAIHRPHTSPDSPLHDFSGAHVCKWKACTETFSSCDDLTAHIASVHVGGGRAHYECFWHGCDRHGTNGFSSKQKISRHLQSHTGHRPFQCQVCNQNFSEAATLQQHMRRHTREKPYICDFPGCGKAFAITGALTIHKRTHNGLRPFKCKFCDKAFSESSNLSKHLRTHTGARPYLCSEDGCQKAFARPDQLARHMNVHRKKDAKG